MRGSPLCRTKALFVASAITLAPGASEAASIVTEWLDVVLPAVNHATPEPTTSTRFLLIYHTAVYEAWAAYDPVAVGAVTGDTLQGKGGAATTANKREAISHAAHAALSALAPVHGRFFDARMAELGYEPGADTAPARLGRQAAAAVLASRRDDGANAENDYADTSGYMTADPSHASHWQPIMFAGEPQMAMTPHWGRVTPFALPNGDAFRPAPPPEPGTDAFAAQLDEILALSAGLTDEHKAVAEFWIPWGAPPASHLTTLAKWVSLRDDLRLDADVKLFFVLGGALFDAGIAAWDAKYAYDHVRPVTAVRAQGARPVEGWTSEGPAQMEARAWRPYLPTVPFPEYVSGHSAFTAAWARTLELLTGSPEFGFTAEVERLSVENRRLAEPIALTYPTFWSAAEASGRSRLLGGLHWGAGNREGLALGRRVGERAWTHAQALFSGRVLPAASP